MKKLDSSPRTSTAIEMPVKRVRPRKEWDLRPGSPMDRFLDALSIFIVMSILAAAVLVFGYCLNNL